MDCVSFPYFKIKGNCDDLGSSGVWLDGIEGITLKKASQIADPNYLTGIELIRADEMEAVRYVKAELIKSLSKTFKTGLSYSSIIQRLSLNYSDISWKSGTIGVKIVGKNSPYTGVNVSTIEFICQEDGEATIRINDNGVNLDKAVDLVQGLNRIRLDYTSKNDLINLSILNSTTAININNSMSGRCDDNCLLSCLCADVTQTDIDGDSNDLCVGYSIECVCLIDELICKFKDLLIDPIRYALAGKLFTRMLVSDNAVPCVYNGKEGAEFMVIRILGGQNKFTGVNEKGKLKESIDTLTDAIIELNSTESGPCLSCKSNLSTQINLP